jgi:hypothetical protein
MKRDVQWGALNDTVSFKQHSWLEFNAAGTYEASKGLYDSDDVDITNMNFVFHIIRLTYLSCLTSYILSPSLLFPSLPLSPSPPLALLSLLPLPHPFTL